jgi:hypothetical protein
MGDFNTKEECEKEMGFTGEPESVDYMIIRGEELEYEDAPAIYPFKILEWE